MNRRTVTLAVLTAATVLAAVAYGMTNGWAVVVLSLLVLGGIGLGALGYRINRATSDRIDRILREERARHERQEDDQ